MRRKDKKASDAPAGPSRLEIAQAKAQVKAEKEANKNNYLAGLYLPSSDDEPDTEFVGERVDKKLDVQVRWPVRHGVPARKPGTELCRASCMPPVSL